MRSVEHAPMLVKKFGGMDSCTLGYSGAGV